MSPKCQICQSGRAAEIDALLASNLSLTKVATRTGFGRLVIWRHSKHESEAGASSDAMAANRALLRQWQQLHRKSMKAGNLDAAARALQAIAELQGKIAAAQPSASPDGNLPRDSIVAIREALGYSRAAARSGRESPNFAFVLHYDDSDPKDPESTRSRRLSEDEFLEHVLKRSGWRASLVTVLSHMLQYGNAPEPVRTAAKDFLTVLSQEDKNERLGLLEDNRDESSEAETGADDDHAP